MTRLLLFIGFILSFNQMFGQCITIKSVSLQPADKSAIEQLCLDNNGDTCALLKIKTNHVEGIQFSNPNQYIKSSYKDGVYWVYVPDQSRKLDFLHKDYMPVSLDMEAYGYRRLKKGKTYLVNLDIPRLNELKSSIIIKVEPKNSNIIFDDKNYGNNPNGTFEIPISYGNHTYMVSSPNYYSKNGSVGVGKTEVKTMTVTLQPIMHEILIGSNVNNARVYVDNLDYGKVGKMMIPQGVHNIRVQADGFIDSEKEIIVSSSTKNLSFILTENKQVTHIHATKVTIYSDSEIIYKNNKKIKGWYNGATIMFMPGKYLLSSQGNSKIIIVGTEPMEVHL